MRSTWLKSIEFLALVASSKNMKVLVDRLPGLKYQKKSALITSDSETVEFLFNPVHYLKISN